MNQPANSTNTSASLGRQRAFVQSQANALLWLRWGLIVALALAALLALQLGAVRLQLNDFLTLLGWGADYIPYSNESEATAAQSRQYVLAHIRLPRILFSLCIGAALGLSGALTQALFRNPLADPGLFGVSAGAAASVALSIVFLSHLELPLPTSMRIFFFPALAFLGALATCVLLDRIAHRLTPGSVSGLLLTGIAINALASAVIGLSTFLSTFLANDEQLRNLSTWMLGSLSAANWINLSLIACLLAIALWQLRSLPKALNALALGEAAARQVGIDVQKIRLRVFILVALCTGFAVAWCGIVGFVGLVAPHLVRLMIGSDQRTLLPLSMLMGALLLLFADSLARTLAIPAEIPVGIFTALLGAPFFLLLLRHARNKLSS